MARCSKCHPENTYGEFDFCGACGAYLCGDHMRAGCCGEAPARSGQAANLAKLAQVGLDGRASVSISDKWFREEAVREYASQPGTMRQSVMVDADAEVQNVSVGAWVQAWVWVDNPAKMQKELPK